MEAPSPEVMRAQWVQTPQLAHVRRSVDFDYAGKRHRLVYRMLRPETYARLYRVPIEDRDDRAKFVVPFLLSGLVSWNVKDARGNAVRLNHRSLMGVPEGLLIAVMTAVGENSQRIIAAQAGGQL